MTGSMNIILRKLPNLISFQNKQKYFYEEIHKNNKHHHYGRINLRIRRKYIFEDSYNQLKPRNKEEMLGGLRITF